MKGGWFGLVLMLTACTRSVAPPRLVAPQYEGPIQSRDVAEGGRIYLTLCAACHLDRVNPSGYHWSPGQMRQQIREGNRLMPPILPELLDDAQVEAVLAYLTEMDAIDGSIPPPEEAGPSFERLFPRDEVGDALDPPPDGVPASESDELEREEELTEQNLESLESHVGMRLHVYVDNSRFARDEATTRQLGDEPKGGFAQPNL